MAIGITDHTGPYTANGSQADFPFDFTAMSSGEVVVQINGSTISSTLYTVALTDTGGIVSFLAAPATGASVMVISQPDFSQLSTFENQGAYNLSTINSINRRSAVNDAWLASTANRALLAPVGADDPLAYFLSIGLKGDHGDAATIDIQSTTTLPAGSPATVSNAGTVNDAHLVFGIPKGDTGDVTPALQAAANQAAASALTATAQAGIATTAATSPSFKLQLNPATPTVPPSGVSSGDTYWAIDAAYQYFTAYTNTAGTGVISSPLVQEPTAAVVQAVSDNLSSYRYVTGRPSGVVAGTSAGAGTYLLNDPFATAKTIKRIRIYGGSAGGTATIVRGTLVGTTWTRTGTTTVTVAANSTNTLTTNFAVASGEVIGVSAAANTFQFTSPATADGSGWRSLSQGATSGTASALQTTIRMEFGFDEFVQVVTGASFTTLQSSAGNRKVERMPWQINNITGGGQSNMQGASGGSVSTTQEYDNLSFPPQSNSTTAIPVAMTLLSTENGANNETPIIGMCGYLKERVLNEFELAYTDLTWQLVGCNDGVSSTGIVALSKAGASGIYTKWQSQLTALGAYATANSLSWGHLGEMWLQGESDPTLTQAQYLGYLLQYELDKRTDAKAASGQHIDPILVTWQLSSVNRPVAMAQRQAAQMRKTIVCMGPAYMATYVDLFHVNSTWSKVLGGYAAKAFKQTVIDGRKFEPLDYTSFCVVGNTIYFSMNRYGLTIDTTLIPDQSVASTNLYGFSALNASAVAQTVSSVVIRDNVVAVTFTTAPAAGWVISYAKGFVAASRPWTVGNGGGCGNLRDSAGDLATYQGVPMHNWCMAFDVTL